MAKAEWTSTTVEDRVDWAPGLFTLRIDTRLETFLPGQFVALGLDHDGKRIERLFSIASAPHEPLEFLIQTVEEGELTPHLFALGVGDELFVRPDARGVFVLDRVPDAETLWMFATGTGIAPYVSMLRTETPWRRFSRIVLAHGVRHRADLAYHDELLRHSAEHGGQLRVLSFVTRESPPKGALAGRFTEALENGRLAAAAGADLTPETSQVLLCGNPDMIQQMTALLEARDFHPNRPKHPGHVTTERFW